MQRRHEKAASYPERRSKPSLRWLENNNRWSYYDGSFRVTFQKEQIKNRKASYWYGYASIDGTTYKAYAGASKYLDPPKIVSKLKEKALF